MSIELISQTCCCFSSHYLRLPFGEVLETRVLSPSEIKSLCVETSCLTRSRKYHVIIQAQEEQNQVLISVDARELARYFIGSATQNFSDYYRNDATELLRSKLQDKAIKRLKNAGYPSIVSAITSSLINIEKSPEEYEAKVAECAMKAWDSGVRNFGERWGSISSLMYLRFSSEPRAKTMLDRLCADIFNSMAPLWIKFSKETTKEIARAVVKIRYGLWPQRISSKQYNGFERDGRVYTYIKTWDNNCVPYADKFLPFSVVVIEERGKLPIICFRLKNKTRIKKRAGGEKCVSPLLTFYEQEIVVEADVTFKKNRRIEKNIKYQRKASKETSSIAPILDDPAPYNHEMKNGGLAQVNMFCRMPYYPIDLERKLLESPVFEEYLPRALKTNLDFFNYLASTGKVFIDYKAPNVLYDPEVGFAISDLTFVYDENERIPPGNATPQMQSPEWARLHVEEYQRLHPTTGSLEDSSDPIKLTVTYKLMIWQFGIVLTRMIQTEYPVFLQDVFLRGHSNRIEVLTLLSAKDAEIITIKKVFAKDVLEREFLAENRFSDLYLHYFSMSLAVECLKKEEDRIDMESLIRALKAYKDLLAIRDESEFSEDDLTALKESDSFETILGLVESKISTIASASVSEVDIPHLIGDG